MKTANAAAQHRCLTLPVTPEPEPERESAITRWIKDGLSASTVLTVMSIAAGFLTSHAHDQARMDDMDSRIKVIESAYVPRLEHSANDEWLKRTLNEMNERIHHLEDLFMERGNKQ